MAYHLARQVLPEHDCKFSRHDYTLAQLFACLVIREFFGLSYRRTEALLIDSPTWLADVGLTRAPDHNTLWRAFDALLSTRRCERMLDLLAELFAKAKLLTPRRRRTLAIDSTCFERHHRSAHYDRRCRKMALKRTGRPGKWGKSINAARGGSLRRMPKLAIAVDAGCPSAANGRHHVVHQLLLNQRNLEPMTTTDRETADRILIGDKVRIVARGKRGIYTAEFWHNGKHQKRSLKTADLRHARKRAALMEAELATGVYAAPLKTVTIANAVIEYMEVIKGNGRKRKDRREVPRVVRQIYHILRGRRRHDASADYAADL